MGAAQFASILFFVYVLRRQFFQLELRKNWQSVPES